MLSVNKGGPQSYPWRRTENYHTHSVRSWSPCWNLKLTNLASQIYIACTIGYTYIQRHFSQNNVHLCKTLSSLVAEMHLLKTSKYLGNLAIVSIQLYETFAVKVEIMHVTFLLLWI